MKISAITLIGFIFFSIAVTLTGCSGSDRNSDLKKYLLDLKDKVVKNKKEDLLQTLVFPAPVVYQAKTMRTPFQLTTGVTAAGSNVVSEQPLEAYPLNALRFLGTIQQGNDMLAVMQTPDGIVYQVKIGDIIGKQYGKIVNISPDRLEVMEKASPGSADTAGRIVTIQLKEGG